MLRPMRCYDRAALAALVLLSCRGEPRTRPAAAPGAIAGPAPAAEAKLSTIPPYPDTAAVPPPAELAERLAGALPAPDRAAGRRLLEDDILPWRLRALAGHPRPAVLARGVYDGLAAVLAAVDSGQRLAVLRRAALDAHVGRAGEEALALAAARYVLDHPDRRPALARWVAAEGPGASDPRAAARAAIALGLGDGAEPEAGRAAVRAEVARARRRLEVLRPSLQADRTSAEAHRLSLGHLQMALDAADTGSFATAAGPMLDMLRDAGARPAALDVH